MVKDLRRDPPKARRKNRVKIGVKIAARIATKNEVAPMKIFLTNFFSRQNRGDAGILSAMIADLRNEFGNEFGTMELVTDTLEDVPEGFIFEGAPQVHSFFYYAVYAPGARILKPFKIVYVIAATILWAAVKRVFSIEVNFILPKKVQVLIRHYAQSDLIMPVGGGYLNGRKGLAQNVIVTLSLHAILIGIILDKKVVLYSQSIGRFESNYQRAIARYVLNRVDLILAREQKTIEYLNNIGVKAGVQTPRIIKTADPAFAFKSDKKEQIKSELTAMGLNFSKKVLGISVREWFLNQVRQAAFGQQIAEFAKLVAQKGIQVLFIPQVTDSLHKEDDCPISARIWQSCSRNANVFLLRGDYDHYQIKAVYENLDYLVGTRMHANIFALTAGVPAIAIEYDPKTSGIMAELGLEEWVINIEDVTAVKLMDIFERFLKDPGLYLNILANRLPEQISQAKQAARHVISVID